EQADVARPAGEQRPRGGRGRLQEPGDVPQLERVRQVGQRMLPGPFVLERVIDAEDAVALADPLDPGRGRLTEVDPADVAEGVGVATWRGDLLAGQEDDVVPGGDLGKQ